MKVYKDTHTKIISPYIISKNILEKRIYLRQHGFSNFSQEQSKCSMIRIPKITQSRINNINNKLL